MKLQLTTNEGVKITIERGAVTWPDVLENIILPAFVAAGYIVFKDDLQDAVNELGYRANE